MPNSQELLEQISNGQKTLNQAPGRTRLRAYRG
ncbi:Hypothetical protein DPCES_0848 [Desulfitobacterium hafniense]|uniref:Uncharacterized protein n=1 Tax=Desulfitobacterium hafniense TaxID=49338 RepID=A0A098AXA3_DESHA|nr:Hypothetical protein DPCES_0848 [Desulfitobacterium hafniense]